MSLTVPAHASLGGAESSVEVDRNQISGQDRDSTATPNFTVHEIANRRLTVREYIANGSVFAVVWQGKSHPDLKKFLGKYADDYRVALARAPKHVRGLRSSRVEGDRLVVEKSGHLGSMRGRAYVPSLIPAGVQLNEIR